VNSEADRYERYKERSNELKLLDKQQNELTEIIHRLRNERAQLARSIDLPVDGVSFDDDGVIRVNGIPFDQLSSSEKIRISARIGAAVNSALRIMLIRDGSLLDETSFDELVGVAEEEDVQLWIESVGAHYHEDAIHIEAGEIRER
jgi:hypothetical protein